MVHCHEVNNLARAMALNMIEEQVNMSKHHLAVCFDWARYEEVWMGR